MPIQLPCTPSMTFNYHVPPLCVFSYHVPPLFNKHVPPPTSPPGPSAREAPDKWPWCLLPMRTIVIDRSSVSPNLNFCTVLIKMSWKLENVECNSLAKLAFQNEGSTQGRTQPWNKRTAANPSWAKTSSRTLTNTMAEKKRRESWTKARARNNSSKEYSAWKQLEMIESLRAQETTAELEAIP